MPELVRVEYLNDDGTWRVGHAGISLIDPAAYVQRLADNDTHARATIVNLGAADGQTFIPDSARTEEIRRSAVERFAEGMDLPVELLTSEEDSVSDDTTDTTEDLVSELDDMLAEFEDAAGASPSTEPDPTDAEDFDPDELLASMRRARDEHEASIPERESLFIGMPGTMDYIFDGHAGAGPSGAERWMNCTASLGASRRFLETLTENQRTEFAQSSEAARQGTTAHAAAEVEANVLLGNISPDEGNAVLIGLAEDPVNPNEAYNEEMAEYITEYVDLIQTYADERGEEYVLIEQRVEATIPLMTVDSDGDPNLHDIPGSADCVVLPTPEDPVLVVADLKYGSGLDVDVDENPQVRIYGLGVLDLLADEETGKLPEWLTEIRYHIVQPRLGGIKTWTETVDDLLDWRDDVLSPALTEALGGQREGAKFVPSDTACQWCPVRGSCPALTTQRIEAASELFDTIVEAEVADGPGAFPETSTLDAKQLGSLYQQIKGLTSIADDLKAEIQRRLHRGDSVPGFKLVNYSPARRWDEKAEKKIRKGKVKGLSKEQQQALFTEPKLVSPTVAEKILGKEGYVAIEPLVDKPEKKPVVGTENDRRSEWAGRPPESMFDIEED